MPGVPLSRSAEWGISRSTPEPAIRARISSINVVKWAGASNMKKSIIFIGLAGLIIVGGITGYFLWKSTRTAQGFFTSGKKYYDQKKYPEATVQFLNSLKKDAHHRDSRFYLALSYLEDKNLAGAVKALRALLEYYPNDIPANLQLG